MIISRDELPLVNTINIAGIGIEVVKVFKLLGVQIDDSLSFSDHIRNIKNLVNKKLFALKRI